MSDLFTPGPWKVQPEFDGFVYADGPLGDLAIASVTGYVQAYGVDRQNNARLIAAAPMLLDGAVDALAAFRLLRMGAVAAMPESVAMIDAHIDELEYAISEARQSHGGLDHG